MNTSNRISSALFDYRRQLPPKVADLERYLGRGHGLVPIEITEDPVDDTGRPVQSWLAASRRFIARCSHRLGRRG